MGSSKLHQPVRILGEYILLSARNSGPSGLQVVNFGAGGWRPSLCTQVWEGLGTGLQSIRPAGPKQEQVNGVTVKLGSYFRHEYHHGI